MYDSPPTDMFLTDMFLIDMFLTDMFLTNISLTNMFDMFASNMPAHSFALIEFPALPGANGG